MEKKNTIENNSFTVSESNGLIQCRRCRESIKHDAIICHHCGSMQRTDLWKIVSNSAKWIGILTAFTTLIIGIVQINKILQVWQEKKKAISELVEATKIQEKANDYNNAWYLIREARNIDFASKEAREYEIILAKNCIKKASYNLNLMFPHLPEYIDLALKALYRGAASKNPKDVADSIAHIGWANFLRSVYFAKNRNAKGKRQVLDFTSNFRDAIKLDPYNCSAHVGLGYTILSWSVDLEKPQKKIDKAMQHFSKALKHCHERGWVRKYQFKGLRDNWSRRGRQMILQISNNIRKNNSELHSDASIYAKIMFRKIWFMGGDDEREYEINLSAILSSIPPKELLATYEWLLKDADFKSKKNVPSSFHPINYKFIKARLLEANNDFKSAFELYSKCLSELEETKPDGITPDQKYRIYHIESAYLRYKNLIIDSIERVKRLMSSGQK